MGILDGGFKLPGVNRLVESTKNKLVSGVTENLTFAVSDAGMKLNEVTTSLMTSIGGAGPFTKISANLPTIAKLSAQAQLSGDPLGDFLNTKKNYDETATASQVKSAAGVQKDSNEHKVSLTEIGTRNRVVFDILPEIVESHSVEYDSIAPVQAPGAFQKFKGTSAGTWTVNITLISRTSEEATANYDILCRLRGWTKPFFGARTGVSYPGKIGAPPPVLLLKGLRDLVGPLPVVITSLNWNWPRDVDYIPTTVVSATDGNFIPFPVILSLPISLVESLSVDQMNKFSLADYRVGLLDNAFNKREDDEFQPQQQVVTNGKK